MASFRAAEAELYRFLEFDIILEAQYVYIILITVIMILMIYFILLMVVIFVYKAGDSVRFKKKCG